MAVEVGDAAPDFALPDQDRQTKKLSDFRGSNVLLAFYPGAFTGGCTREVCSLRDNMAMLNGMQAQVLGISTDPPASQKAWADQNQLNFSLLSDYKRNTVEAYGVAFPDFLCMEGFTAARRSIFLIDKDGTVRYKWLAERDPIPPYEEISAVLKTLS
jgi:glutaredoxin-dependent peroxiredoxin